jgi:hypothetical protein
MNRSRSGFLEIGSFSKALEKPGGMTVMYLNEIITM